MVIYVHTMVHHLFSIKTAMKKTVLFAPQQRFDSATRLPRSRLHSNEQSVPTGGGWWRYVAVFPELLSI